MRRAEGDLGKGGQGRRIIQDLRSPARQLLLKVMPTQAPEEKVEGPSCPFNHSGAAGNTVQLLGLPADSDSLGRSKGETDNKEEALGSLGVAQGLPSGQVLRQM